MKFSSILKVENHKITSTFKNESLGCIEESLTKSIPLVFHGIYLQSDIEGCLPKLGNAIWIEPRNSQIQKLNTLEKENMYTKLTSIEISCKLLNDVKLSEYDALIINNFHQKDPHIDLVVANMKYIQDQRKLANLPMLKMVLCTYPLTMSCLLNLFNDAMIFNIDVLYCENAWNLEIEISSNNYLENVLKIIYLLFTNKLEEFDSSFDTANLKVLVFLADLNDVNAAFKWLNCHLLNMINAYIFMLTSDYNKKNLSEYASCLVLTNNMDKNAIDSLNVSFDYVIDSGYISSKRLFKQIRVDTAILEKIECLDSLVRSHYARPDGGKVIQLYNTEKQLCNANGLELSHPLKVRHDVTDFLFCQIALGAPSFVNFSTVLSYFPLPLKYSIEHLIRSGLVVKSNASSDNSQTSKVITHIINHELTELGRKCLQLKPLDCRLACVLISSTESGCFISCLTLVSLLQISDDLFINLYGNDTNHLKKLKNIYDGNDDLAFLIKLYRHYCALSKDDRVKFIKSYSLNKQCMNSTSRIRTSIKEKFPFEYKSEAKSGMITKCFLEAYPFQIAQYSASDKCYIKPGIIKQSLYIDPYSFANNEREPVPYVFYYSAYMEDEKHYMKYVSPISKELWVEYSAV